MRINKFIALAAGVSRRQAEDFVREGLVLVNGRILEKLSFDVQDGDTVVFSGKQLSLSDKKVYIAVNKPMGVVSTSKDRFAKKTVVDLLPDRYKHLSIVGRLDKDSRGLLLLSDDGAFCNKITHPRYGIEKEYMIELKGEVLETTLVQACKGVKEGGEFLKIDSYRILKALERSSRVTVVISHGKKRELRRIFSVLGHRVMDLKRIRIGSLKLKQIPEGHYKVLSAQEVKRCLK